MNRPLLITDCDEVLLHMVTHFADWLDERHGILFSRDQADFGRALVRRADGHTLAPEEVWPLLDGFFDDEMDRQTLVPGVADALDRVAQVADVVVLTNLGDHRQEARAAQLQALGLDLPVFCNQGPKGPTVARILAERRPPVSVFVDDIPSHHGSVAAHAPGTWRLHLIAEPWLADLIPPADDAHARLDSWPAAVDWIMERLQGRAAA